MKYETYILYEYQPSSIPRKSEILARNKEISLICENMMKNSMKMVCDMIK
mgnify:CR=1 FL=1